MRIIISPAKKMKVDEDSLEALGLPVFLEEAGRILAWVKALSLDQAQKLWACNDQIARQNYDRFQDMDLESRLTPALIAYEGIQYQYMAPTVFERQMLAYVQDHLRILSGFYGVLKPMDGVRPYRLEMQAKAKIGQVKNLYDFWGDKLYREVIDQSGIIINLASKEYAKAIEPYLQPSDRMITCLFSQDQGGKIVQKATYAKMARGEMVQYMAKHQVRDIDQIKAFKERGYQFRPDLSSDREFVFVN